MTEVFEEQSRGQYDFSRQLVAEALGGEQFDDSNLAILSEQLYNRRSESLAGLTAVEQAKLIVERTGQVLPQDGLVTALARSKTTGVPLEVKYGIDPTGAEVHMGHAVPMLILNRFQRMGHRITFVVGDFTAKIGDPSGRVSSRPVLTDENIRENMANYGTQVKSLFDMENVNVVKNGDWLNEFPLSRLMGIVSKIPVASLLQRKDFRRRIEEGTGITQAELLYPVVMALDSVELDSDIEIGGKDQFLNLQMCRTVMEICGKNPEVIVTTDILEGTDGSGAKMSKSLGNYVGLTHSPDEIFGRIMSIPDNLMGQYFTMLTELDPAEWNMLLAKMEQNQVNPMEVKKLLAVDMVNILHGRESAQAAKLTFQRKFSDRNYVETGEDAPVLSSTQDMLGQLALIRNESKSALRRLLTQGAIQHIDQTGKKTKVTAEDDLVGLRGGMLKVGKLIVELVEEQSGE